jgi:hypothetical protein
MTITRFNDAICGCCRRAATGFGYAPKTGQSILWVCDDPTCLQLAKDTYTMKQDQFSRIEALAAAKAAEAMGQRLDEMGVGHVFDGGALKWEHWLEAMRAGIAGYRRALVEDLKGEAPF